MNIITKVIEVEYSNAVSKKTFYWIDSSPESLLSRLGFKETSKGCWEAEGGLGLSEQTLWCGKFKASIHTPMDGNEAKFLTK